MSAAGRAPIGAPSSRTLSAAPCNEARDCLQEGRLACAVGADDGDGLALLQRRVDAVQRLEVAVERREPAGLEAAACIRPRCRYRSGALRAIAITSCGAPSAILRPKLSTTSRSTTASRACTTCSIHRIATPVWRISRMVATSSRHSPSVRPPAISSSSRSRGAGRERARHLQPLALQQRQRAGAACWRA